MKISKTFILGSMIGSSLILASCASSETGLKQATANNIGGVLSNDVAVSDIDRGATTVSWKAKVNNTNYSCESDDMVRKVNCVAKK
ncbi:hypothetical protein [Francisella frigiditurris]|uniref:Putative lipoprotein n=1 Tax=Francisella frigiditurris TaxID=1542390 RepID=A0A1J0KTV5_9GAMM|nr:hypothetical protein [Francisella frigiditurris]APC97068.1 putative lipoprotein [Francisella frigiditurris]